MKVRIACLQLLPGPDLSGQLQIGIAACREAKKLGADIALFPEMWSDGYEIPHDPAELDRLAMSPDCSFIRDDYRLQKD